MLAALKGQLPVAGWTLINHHQAYPARPPARVPTADPSALLACYCPSLSELRVASPSCIVATLGGGVHRRMPTSHCAPPGLGIR
jgi:hypothetical protein